MLKKYGMQINKGMNIKLNKISIIWSLKEIFLLFFLPNKQKHNPKISETIRHIIYEPKFEIELK